MTRQSVLLIISGSIAGRKSLDLIRLLKERGINVNCILTKGGAEFLTPKQISALSGTETYQELFTGDDDESQMPHIRLSREADLVVIAPASANLIAKMAQGYADDLASTALLASNKKILVAPAMNAQMWLHPATQRNIQQIQRDGAFIIEPGEGMLACGEIGPGRMAEPAEILEYITAILEAPSGKLKAIRALVTSGPTHEAIDPVRYIANRSSGKQGHAIAAALARQGADVTLITGPTAQRDPLGVKVKHITSAQEMLKACEQALPVDIAVCAAAVSDWRIPTSPSKMKKQAGKTPVLKLVENPDILKHLATHKKRPALVIGFAAETENLVKNATAKRKNKQADWIIANDVSGNKSFDSDENEVVLVTALGAEKWPLMSKAEVAEKLVSKIADTLSVSKNKRKKS